MDSITRRSFVRSGLAAGLGLGSTLAQPATAAGPRRKESNGGRRNPDVIVIGAGAFGGWTALRLQERGSQVTLLDAFGAGNPRAASGDETRQIRVGYGDQELYSRWALKALEEWRRREVEWGRQLLFPAGRLQLQTEWTAGLRAQRTIFDRLGVAYEVLAHDELANRYPQMRFEGVEFAFFEPGSALLHAMEATSLVATRVAAKGGEVRIGHAVPAERSGGRLESIRLASGETLSAATFVFACGPWLRTLFPDLLGDRISTPRREVFYFGTPPGDNRYFVAQLPNWTEPGCFSYPSTGAGVKVVPSGGAQLDPDSAERIVSPEQTRRAYDWVARRLPGLSGQPIVHTRVCQTEYTDDSHFIIDRHPELENMWIVGGGSGHGFKHGPVVGEYAANRVLGVDGDPAEAATFAFRW